MPVVAVLNDESDLGRIVSVLKAYGCVVANHHNRPGASILTSSLRIALGPRSDEDDLQCHELPLLIDGEPWWTSVLVMPPRYDFDHHETTALAARALTASNECGEEGMFLYHDS
ncbi:hypothetical protein MKZ87_07215 [Pseudomonas sp. MCal1]|uniref:hypothetical protein n=1 Tax=Pseudomonas sp. MCal1 TaxID=2919887 RepID=UPI002255F859|nr:hypothetical protein [Pseudomonas sp. MCal1]MCX4217426.1 hypothetical protein [Pseudomonas sp. MCal1]